MNKETEDDFDPIGVFVEDQLKPLTETTNLMLELGFQIAKRGSTLDRLSPELIAQLGRIKEEIRAASKLVYEEE